MSNLCKKVLVTVTNFSRFCPEAKKLLENNGFMVLEPCTKVPQLSFEELKVIMSDIDAVIAGLDHWTDEVFDFSKRLRVIARFGVGVDKIDLASAKAHGIYVTNARASFNAVSEMAIALMFCCLRNIPALDHGTKHGVWERFVGDELCHKTIGLVGFGKIPQTLAKRLASFDVRLLAYDIIPNKDAAKRFNVTLCDLDTLLGESDIVSLHLPVTPETENMFNAEMFERFKTGAYFINTARGAIVDESALYDALVSGKLKAAATDVFRKEPVDSDNPLLKLKNFYCTPHQAAETYQTMYDISLIAAQAIIDTFNGKKPATLLNG